MSVQHFIIHHLLLLLWCLRGALGGQLQEMDLLLFYGKEDRSRKGTVLVGCGTIGPWTQS